MARKNSKDSGKNPSNRSKNLNFEDNALWQHVAAKVTPMASNRHTGFEEFLKTEVPFKARLMSRTSAPKKRNETPLVPRAELLRPTVTAQNKIFREAVEPSVRQNVAGLDRNTSERLRKGKMVLEGRVDLHGLTRREAFARLQSFLKIAHRQGKRCVLVITGKGSSKERTDDAPFMGSGRKGVLREEVPRWLSEPDMRGLILDYRQAQPKHGGGGALYVLLRRSR